MIYSASRAIARMISAAVEDMPGVVASGAPKSDKPCVYIVMNSDRGYRIIIAEVIEVDEPDYEPLLTEGAPE